MYINGFIDKPRAEGLDSVFNSIIAQMDDYKSLLKPKCTLNNGQGYGYPRTALHSDIFCIGTWCKKDPGCLSLGFPSRGRQGEKAKLPRIAADPAVQIVAAPPTQKLL